MAMSATCQQLRTQLINATQEAVTAIGQVSALVQQIAGLPAGSPLLVSLRTQLQTAQSQESLWLGTIDEIILQIISNGCIVNPPAKGA